MHHEPEHPSANGERPPALLSPSPGASRPLLHLEPRRLRTWFGYGAMVTAAVGCYFLIRAKGESLPPAYPVPHPGAQPLPGHKDVLATVLLALAAVTIMARLLGAAFQRWLKQPPVIGEIVAGLILGPSVLGALSPTAHTFLLPASAAPYLGLIAKVGVVLFMFLVGLELDPKLLRGHTHATIAISHTSIIAPFLLGAMLSLWLYPQYGSGNVSFTVFSLFGGISLSVTAFPVLARILTDRRVQRTSLGVTALSCAAVDDVSAWTLLALVVGVANSKVEQAGWTLLLVLGYIALMLLGVRPLAVWLAAREEHSRQPLSRTTLAAVCIGLLLSSVATEAIGVHALFGAFLLGAILPHDGRLARQLRERMEDLILVLLLPAFFAFTGMRTQVALVSSARDWLACGLIILVATAGKFGGSFVAARLTGLGWRESSALGILMNTRGLMELIVLNIGLDLGVISPTLFAMYILMALVTTFLTTPVLNLIIGERGFADAPLPIQGEVESPR